MGQVVDVAEDDHGPEPGRQLLEALGHPVALEAGRGLQLGVVLGPGVGERAVVVELVVAARARLASWVEAQLAVIRYIQVVKRASPRNRCSPR